MWFLYLLIPVWFVGSIILKLADNYGGNGRKRR